MNWLFQSFGKGNVGEFTITNIATLVEFGGVKYWQMVFNLPKFSPTKILRYTVIVS